MKTVAIDNGHGLNTPGKRTPIMLDGRVIKEWQFNYPTAKKLGELLKYNGFNIIYVSDTEEDTPLSIRTKKANDAKADAYVSIHFNAYQGVWGDHGGIETYHYHNSTKGKQLADLIQEELIKETGLRDRGVKSANYQVLRETNMVSVLAECGFMDNLDEAMLMLDESYQLKCARAIAKGVCRYFGVEYKEEKKETYSPWANDAMEWAIKLNLTDGANPKEPITLERFITILYRYAKVLD